MPVDPANLTALRFRINVIGISRIFKYPEPIAVINIFPARVGNAAGIRGITHPNTVVLQSAIHAIGTRVVHAYVVELRRRQVPGAGPAGAAVSAAPETAIVAVINLVGIVRVDPGRRFYAVRIRGGTELRPPSTLSNRIKSNSKDLILIFGINNQVGKIKRAPHHVLAGIHLFPAFARVV